MWRATLAAALLFSTGWSGEAAAQRGGLAPVELGEPRAFQRIADAAGAARVVSLGESTHLTREMTEVRLNVLRALHARKGFNVLAFEGSLLESWTAQENAYRSRAPLAERARTFAQQAWFGLWQTEEMEAVAAYALESQNGPNPLYLTSFDLQLGSAFAHRGSTERALGAFLTAVRTASSSTGEDQSVRWVRDLAPGLACKEAPAAQSALDEIGRWIEQDAAPAMASSRPAAHVRALKLAPVMMRARLARCRDAAGRPPRINQELRDRLNAELVQAMLRTERKVILWAHHSHVHHNTIGAAPASTGQHLKAALGPQLYTIGVFANGGSAIDSLLADQSEDGLAPRPVPAGPRFGAEWMLSGLSNRDLFVDLRRAPAGWSAPSTSRLEVEARMPTAPARDFDGAILLHRVSAPELTFLRPQSRPGAAVR